MSATGKASVLAVARDGEHRFGKAVRSHIVLLAGLGVEGDAHYGRTVQHLSRLARTDFVANASHELRTPLASTCSPCRAERGSGSGKRP